MVKGLQNLHTHSTFCDGKDTPEQMILTAIERGFDSIGFSGHSYTPFAPRFCMDEKVAKDYRKEIFRLKEKYRGKFSVFCGVELDRYSDIDLTEYEYIIGSAHYFKFGEQYVGFDRDGDTVDKVIKDWFNGNGLAFAKAYYELLATLPQVAKVDIIGHFDLVAKHGETRDFFDQNDQKYLDCAFQAIDALKGKIPFFEVNTGCISRGYRSEPYPHLPIMRRLLEQGFLPVISSDCHNRQYVDCYFNQACEMLACCGAKERYILTEKGFTGIKL